VTLIANAELVASAWLVQRAGLTSGQVATVLPKDVDGWRAAGFVVAAALLGGAADVDTPERRRAVLQIDAYAAPASQGGGRPPWHRAAQLVERVRVATEGGQVYGQPVTLSALYGGVRVLSAYLLSEPRRVLDDVAGFARFTVDLAIDWVRE